jgi:quinol monooxygenase YgiN
MSSSSSHRDQQELHIFARFRAREGLEEKVAAAMQEMLPPVRSEPGCMSIEVFRSTRDKRLFCLHSRWIDEAAFDVHATLPHTRHFIETVQALIDHPLDVVRTRLMENRS